MLVVSASSLIFVVVIAIWATYLLFHVTRRREHLATARNVDRFSAHMRVLQRRASRSAAPPAGKTSSVALVRAVSANLLYDAQADEARHTYQAGRSGGRLLHASPPPRSEMPASAAPRQVAAVGINRGFALLGRVTSVPEAIVRRWLLLGGSVATALTFLGAMLGPLSWWWFTLALMLVASALVWSRSTVTAARAAFERRAEALRQARGLVREVSANAAYEARPRGPSLPVAQEHSRDLFAEDPDVGYDGYDDADLIGAAAAADSTGAGGAGGPGGSVAAGGVPEWTASPSRDAVFDFAALQGAEDSRSGPFAAGRRVEQGAGTDALDPLGATAGWAPVPVPPPTYVLKARADRPLPTPLDVPVPIEVEDEFDDWQRDTGDGLAAVNG